MSRGWVLRWGEVEVRGREVYILGGEVRVQLKKQ